MRPAAEINELAGAVKRNLFGVEVSVTRYDEVVRALGDQIETFLIGKARDDADERASGVCRGDPEDLQQVCFAGEFAS